MRKVEQHAVHCNTSVLLGAATSGTAVGYNRATGTDYPHVVLFTTRTQPCKELAKTTIAWVKREAPSSQNPAVH